MRRTTSRKRRNGKGGGVVLILALWLTAFLSMMVLTFIRTETIEMRVTMGHADRLRARELAKSGLAWAQAVLAEDETAHDDAFDVWRSSESDFREHVIGDDGYVSLLYNNLDDQSEIAYGIADENGKINVNTAPADVLEELPGMTDEVAAAIADWIDQDDNTESGAETDYYATLDPPYAAKNGPFDTVEEMLLVKGVTPELLYGEDANRNGVLDPNEDDGDETYPPDDQDGVLDGGLMDYLTVYSYENNVAADGTPRVNINGEDQNQMQQQFKKILGPVIGNGRANTVAGEVSNYLQLIKRTNANFQFVSPANLLGTTSLTTEEFRQVVDYLTTTDDPKREGLVNVNTARREVLVAITNTLQGFEEDDVDLLIAYRGKEETDLDDMGWILEALEGDQTKFQLLAPFVTVRSGQFLAQAVGVVATQKVFCRILAVIDRVPEPSVFLYWKDISGLGAPFAVRSIEEIESEAESSTG